MATEWFDQRRKPLRQDRSHNPWGEANGRAQCEKSACCVRRGGAGNVAWPRWCDTRNRKSEPTGNTNFGLNRRASPRPPEGEVGESQSLPLSTATESRLIRRAKPRKPAAGWFSASVPRRLQPRSA